MAENNIKKLSMENINEEFTSIRNHKGRNNPLPHRHRMVGCDATNPEAVTKIFKLKRVETKHDCFDER
jgi:hypothetical protein